MSADFLLHGELANLHRLDGRVQMAESIRREALGELGEILAERGELSDLRPVVEGHWGVPVRTWIRV